MNIRRPLVTGLHFGLASFRHRKGGSATWNDRPYAWVGGAQTQRPRLAQEPVATGMLAPCVRRSGALGDRPSIGKAALGAYSRDEHFYQGRPGGAPWGLRLPLTFQPRRVRTAIRCFPNTPEHSGPPTASATATRANARAATLSPPTILSANDDAAVNSTANLLDLVFNETGSGEYRRYCDGAIGPDLGASKSASARLRESLRNETLFWVPGAQVQGPGRHWIVVDHASEEDKVVATIGLFECEHDRDQASWVSLFAVHPDCRGLGLGTKLLRWVEHEARAAGKKLLCLNTRARPNEAASCLYSTYGFSIKKEWGSGGDGPNHTIRALDL